MDGRNNRDSGGGWNARNIVAGMAVGLVIGTGIGLAIENLSLWAGIGVAVGFALGASYDVWRRGR